MIAADYVRTSTDLASMEGANEAARKAANAMLARDASTATRVQLWPVKEPETFRYAKALDRWLFKHGRRHAFEILGIRNAARAANWLRRFEKLAGIARVDDWFDDKFRLSRMARSALTLLGLG